VGLAGVVLLIGCLVLFLATGGLDMSRSIVFPPAVAIGLVAASTVLFVAFIASAIWLVVRA